jgi:hypothetical protein
MQLQLMKIYKSKIFFPFLFFLACVLFLAKHFNIFSVFPTQPKACRGLEEIKVADMEFGGDNFAGGSEGITGAGGGRGAVREV